ncbi:hypothetical protein SDC9_182875 [bioreactor metagenome]|uniref:Uncharacterized protein n=1 Tax=bioreactor metagenome TaxID=1076179 RepID=A0A645H8L2_9ZZZZ
MLIIQNNNVIKSPGPTVDKKQASIEVSVTQPYMINIPLGGIKSPKTEDTVTKAVE